ncbi:hypothetical protein GJ744_000550 [Endocarpon pusillum]|uniref:DUF1917 domain-containing protein n=1 Tax=Endocarpon pusillum TaxID=364733 RepID=A0A8H7AEL5_9EURO|nr:hypothetical protein GJ744_000550 [Endocarpon pusillum]
MEKMGGDDSGSSTVSERDVDESTVLSDESGFYGDEDMKAEYELRNSEFDPAAFWKAQHHSLQSIAEQNREAAEAKAARARYHRDRLNAAQKMEHADSVDSGPAQSIDVTSDKDPMDIDLPSPRQEPSPSPTQELHNPYEGDPMAKQLHEPLPTFLSRLPPSTTPLTTGPWIWIANPHHHAHRPAGGKRDIAGLKQGHRLLKNFSAQRRQLEARHPEKPAGTITRMMKPAKDLLEEDLVKLARAKNVKEGKWMLFPSPKHVDGVWVKVARATWEGELGVGAKVATKNDDDDERSEKSRLVCVYTRDFEDRMDVERVLQKLVGMGLVGGEQGIFYKCDAYTYLEVMGGNEWKLKASMYGSREMLKKG